MRVLWPMNTPIEITEPAPTITPSTTSERAPMKQLSSMMVGRGLQRLEHAADADAAREVHVAADLRAGADRGPGVDHGAGVDVGADVDVAGHQHHVRARCRRRGARWRAAPRARRRRANSAALVVARTSAAPCRRSACSRRRCTCVVVRAEVQQHGLLQPLVHHPARRRCFSATRAAPAVQQRRCSPRWPGAAPAVDVRRA